MMDGLKSANPKMDMDMDMDMGEASGEREAVSILQSAIDRHERHMNGTESTSTESQQQLMDELNQVLQILTQTEA